MRLLQPVFESGLVGAPVVVRLGQQTTDTLFHIAVAAGTVSSLELAVGALALLQVKPPALPGGARPFAAATAATLVTTVAPSCERPDGCPYPALRL